MFALETMTKGKLTDVVVLSQKNRQPDENQGAKLSFELSLSNEALAYLDGHLKQFLFTKNGSNGKAAQSTLDGVPVVSDAPNLTAIGSKCGWLKWEGDFTGYDLVVDQGLGTKRSNLEIGDCVLSGMRMRAKEGGTVQIKFNVESADVSESAFGKLAKLKSRELELMLSAPEVAQGELDESHDPFGSTDPVEAAKAGQKPKGAKKGGNGAHAAA